MHSRFSLLLLTFLLATFLSITAAIPLNPGVSPAVASNSRTGTTRSSRVNNTPPKGPKPKNSRKKEHGGGEGGGRDGEQDLDTDTEVDGGSDTEWSDSSEDGQGKCRAPLSQQFAAQFTDGHGCKKIAEAFSNCNVHDRWFCSDIKAQKNCLCGQPKKFDDALVARCYRFLQKQGPTGAHSVEPYIGLCGF
ncbi:MAG: hypothetical protein Q9184_003742 [Pyrenodesmia sp. 2 TL-2023]